jgi:N-acetylglucosaminyldiphosphoundecaprenol N-acetyl-beta-D-mannosaminyltransferase
MTADTRQYEATPAERIRIGRVDVDAPTPEELNDRLDALITSGRRHYVCFCEAHLCVRASLDPALNRAVRGASLVIPDGVAMTAGARLIGRRFPARLPGPSVMLQYLRHSVPSGKRHFFYGGSEGVAEQLADGMAWRFPGLQVAGTFSPPFRSLTPVEFDRVRHRIESAGTDVLWVGLGAPKQERWMARNIHRLNVPLMLGVGAAFDFHTGRQKWAPRWIRRAGLEWLYRAVTGGRRVLVRNVSYELKFTGLIFRQALAPARGQRRRAA